MMRVAKILFLSLLFLGCALFFWKKENTSSLSLQQYPVSEEKPFVILIPSYNNEAYVEKNLRSVFSQKYENYRVIYIDDQSRDDTLSKAGLLLSELDRQGRTTLIHNERNRGGLANVYNAVHTCLDHEILVLLDGDDFFAHEHVLKRLNELYANPSVWLTYGNHLDYPSFHSQPSATARDRSCLVTPPLRSFYAALFKEIELRDLMYRGTFIPMAWDLAIMLPMIEMAKNHAHFIDETLYLSNHDNPLSDFKINPNYHAECEQYIRKKSSYRPLKRLKSHVPFEQEKADVLVFSFDHPMQVYALLESLEKNVSGLNTATVLYRASTVQLDTAYLEVKLRFPHVHFIKQNAPPSDFKKLVNATAFENQMPASKYILFASDTLIIKEPIDLSDGISVLEKTCANGIYYNLHQNLQYCSSLQRFQPVPTHTPLPGIPAQETPHVWQFSEGLDDFNAANSLHFVLYRKEDLKKVFQKLEFDSPSSLLFEWGQRTPARGLGLFYPTSKVIEICPRNSKELLEKFKEGLKINLHPLFHTSSPSQKVEKEVVFTSK